MEAVFVGLIVVLCILLLFGMQSARGGTLPKAGRPPDDPDADLNLDRDVGTSAGDAVEDFDRLRPSDFDRIGDSEVTAEEAEERARFFGRASDAEASRTVWPLLRCDDVVAVGRAFDVEVGLAEVRDRRVGGTGALRLPETDVDVRVELLLDGFGVVHGDRVFNLRVTTQHRFPMQTVQLVALAGEDWLPERAIDVTYSVAGELRGVAHRLVRVVGAMEDPIAVIAPRTEVAAVDLRAPDAPEVADLTVIIRRGDDASGRRLRWSVDSPLVTLPTPAEAPECDIGDRPEAFLQAIVGSQSDATSNPLAMYRWLQGVGSLVADKMPTAVKEAIIRVMAARSPQPASILIYSAEPHVPWELATLSPDPLPDTSPFLAAQAVVGRWIFTASPPPKLPLHVDVGTLAVITAVYEAVPNWDRLEEAEQEGNELAARFAPAHRILPHFPEVDACLRGTPPAEVLHFALHGRFDLEGRREGLVLLAPRPGRQGEFQEFFLQPLHVRGAPMPAKPFVFLNACQVGAGRELLGDYGGMVEGFLRAGAAAVVAPVWSVDDGLARDFALAFYAEAYAEERVPPAEILRRRRAGATDAAALAGGEGGRGIGTNMAYLFFGHPNFVLKRAPVAENPPNA